MIWQDPDISRGALREGAALAEPRPWEAAPLSATEEEESLIVTTRHRLLRQQSSSPRPGRPRPPP